MRETPHYLTLLLLPHNCHPILFVVITTGRDRRETEFVSQSWCPELPPSGFLMLAALPPFPARSSPEQGPAFGTANCRTPVGSLPTEAGCRLALHASGLPAYLLLEYIDTLY